MKRNTNKYREVTELPPDAKTVKQYASDKGISQTWVYRLLKEGKATFEIVTFQTINFIVVNSFSNETLKYRAFTKFIDSNVRNMAESHIECYKFIYEGKSKRTVLDYLLTTFDNSVEVENVEIGLKRKLTDSEKSELSNKFNNMVFRLWKK